MDFFTVSVLHGCTDTVKVLSQEERIDVNAPSKERYTPLHLAALLGTAVAVALFATATVAIELIPIVIAVVAVTVAALAVGGVTYMMLKPSTKMEEAKEEKTAGNEQMF